MVSVLAPSVPDAMIGATLGCVVLVAAIFLLARSPGAPEGTLNFGFAFTCNVLRYLVLLFWPEKGGMTFVFAEALHGASNLLLLSGSLKLWRPGRFMPVLAIAWVALVGYLALVAGKPVSPWWHEGPPYVLGFLCMTVSGVLFLRHSRRFPGLGYGLVGVLLLIWGLHKIDFLLLGGFSWAQPARLLVTNALSVALAVAVIVLAERSQAGFAARVRADLAASRRLADTSARHLAVILDHLADGVVTASDNGRIFALNPVAERIFGVTGRSMLGRPIADLLPDPDFPSSAGGLPAALIARRETVRDCTVRRADGAPLILEVSASQVNDGPRSLLIAMLRDVSAQRRNAAVDTLVNDVNQRVLEGGEISTLAPFVCRRLVALFGVRMAWIGARVQDGGIAIRGVAGPEDLERRLLCGNLRWDGGAEGLAGDVLASGVARRVVAAETGDQLQRLAGLAAPLRVNRDVLGVIVLHSEVTFREDQMLRLESLAERLSVPLQMMLDQRRMRLQGAAIAAAANAIFITDRNGRIEWVNEAFVRLSGYCADDVLGQSPRLLHSGAQTGEVYKELWRTILSGEVWRGELIERGKDGSLYTVEQTITPMLDRQKMVSHFVVVQEDITGRKQAEEKIRFLSNYDTMTGLPNRGLFRERLAQALARGAALRHPVAVLFLDLDRFSRINDTMGHDLGDRLLTDIVDRLGVVTRSADMLARVGGDEFAVLLDEGVDTESVAHLARRMLDVVTAPYELDGHHVHVGASIGISLYPEDAEDADQLIKNADIAMYRAIHDVPNGYRFFSNAMNEDVQRRNGLERDLRLALSRQEFVLHYQPQRDVLTGSVIGLEALVRWNHPEQGLVYPDSFIPLAEETGLIVPLGEIVLGLACRQVRDWHQQGLPVVPVAVNLSAVQLHREEFVTEISQIVSDSGIRPEWIELELTESCLMADAEAAERMLRALDRFGIKLAIDDFGTGYSSLNYLKRFPVSKLKIDRVFVHSLADEKSDDAAIARAIITLGHSLGMRVVSEGVETEEQLSYLRRQGCDAVQGFLFSRPVPAEDVPPMLLAPVLHTRPAAPRVKA
ncbi:MAG: EAL domain-containing protein [Telmatospirillum sp.]|nr:EAL domain-containing protein [Telmatospirillum sp.]